MTVAASPPQSLEARRDLSGGSLSGVGEVSGDAVRPEIGVLNFRGYQDKVWGAIAAVIES